MKTSDIDELSKRLEERVLEDGVIDLDTVNHSRFPNRGYSSNKINTTNFKKAIDEVIERSKKTKQREAIRYSFLKDWRYTIYKPQSYIENEAFFHSIDNERLAEAIAQWRVLWK